MTGPVLLKVVLATFLWALCYPLITVGIALAPHLSIATLRAVIAGLALIVLAVALRRPFPRSWHVWMVLSLVGLGATSLGFLGMFHAAEFVSPGIATMIANTQPLLAAALAAVVLGERLTPKGKASMVIGFLGILAIAAPKALTGDQQSYLIGLSYIILAALGVTISNVAIKHVAGRVDPFMAMGVQLLLGSVPLAVAAGMTEDFGAIEWSVTFLLVLIALSFLGSALVYVIWMSVLEEVPLGQANTFSFLVPVFGLSMGVLFFSETLDWYTGLGAILVFSSILLASQSSAVAKSKLPVRN
ncbi:MAG: DMT family transporter [Roseovarius sp.]|nr:DMT family transporter [Roseovarius sp.]